MLLIGKGYGPIAVLGPATDPTAGPYRPPGWTEDALCTGDAQSDAWYEAPGSLAALRAASVCMACPVKRQCLQAAMAAGETYGIHGGVQFEVPEVVEVPLCPAGHEMTGYNLITQIQGKSEKRKCRTCKNTADAESRARIKDRRREAIAA